MPKVCELSDFLWKRRISAREACLNGGRGLCLVVAADRVRGGVPVRGGGKLVGMDNTRCPVAALSGSWVL